MGHSLKSSVDRVVKVITQGGHSIGEPKIIDEDSINVILVEFLVFRLALAQHTGLGIT